ncbi:MAG: hypothetical protein ACK4R6_13185 [Spirosomataceae bacterium]
MKIETIEKSIQYVSDSKGVKNALLIDITNKNVAQYFEDLLDSLEAEKRMNTGGGRPLAEFKKEYLANRK